MQHDRHRVPVTALAFLRSNIILAGEGNSLRAYSQESRLLADVCAFVDQAIHGIVINENEASTAFVYGGHLSRTVKIECGEQGNIELVPGPAQDVGDWILNACFIPALDDSARSFVSIITAHNALYLICLDGGKGEAPKSPRLASVECLISRSNCLLYSAHISGLTPSQCLVASGTAFGDIIVWSAFLSNTDGAFAAHAQTHYTFSAHEGSIFGVQISPMLTLPGSDNAARVLASCSDDRNIKLWDITDLTVERPIPRQMQHGTGFGTSDRKTNVAPPCLAKAMAHVSRIWQVRFVIAPTFKLQMIQSFGEDASIITWRLHRVIDQSTYCLEKLRVTTAHAGKNIWAVTSDAPGRVATGGADGAIALYSDPSVVEQAIEFAECRLNGSERTDRMKAYDFFGMDTLLSTTELGGVVQIQVGKRPSQNKTNMIMDTIKSLRSFSMVASVPGLAFIAGGDGSLYALAKTSSDLRPIAKGEGKPAGLFACQLSDHETALLLTTVGSSTARLLLMDLDSKDQGLRISRNIGLILPPSFAVTSFSFHTSYSKTYAILGSRTGSIAIFDLKLAIVSEPISIARLCDLVHGKEAITNLRTYEDSRTGQPWLFSTGRDGTFATRRIFFRDEVIEMELVHQLSLPFGPNIEGMHLSENGSLLIWGFKSKHFVVYDVVARREVMSVECGGAHRTWAFQPREQGGTFVWTKASQVYQWTQNELPYELVNAGGHGREIKSVAVSSNDPQIIATGAEDTDIKLHRFEGGKFTCLQTLRKHNTGVQSLQWTRDDRYLFSSGGFEEFFVWRVSHGIPYLNTGVVCESTHPRSGTSDLRITGFEVHEEEMGSIHDVSQRQFKIIMAYSDSTARLWCYKACRWDMLASGDYLTSCLSHALWTENIHVCTCGGEPGFTSAASDGHLAKWRFDAAEKKLRCSERRKAHQSAVHAVAPRKLADGSALLLSGGDDNAVAISRLHCGSRALSHPTLRIPRAHAAAVTGLVVAPVAGNMYWMVSAGIDQRVKLWRVDVDLEQSGIDGVEVKLLQSVYTPVADVASLDRCRLEDGGMGVVVCGVGMDVWRLPATSDPNGAIGNVWTER